jgi:hypothetical protein
VIEVLTTVDDELVVRLDALDVVDLVVVGATPHAVLAFLAVATVVLDSATTLDEGAVRLLAAGVYAGQHDEPEVGALLWDLADRLSEEAAAR